MARAGEGREKETWRNRINWIWRVVSVNKETVRNFEAIGVFGRFQTNIKFLSPLSFFHVQKLQTLNSSLHIVGMRTSLNFLPPLSNGGLSSQIGGVFAVEPSGRECARLNAVVIRVLGFGRLKPGLLRYFSLQCG